MRNEQWNHRQTVLHATARAELLSLLVIVFIRKHFPVQQTNLITILVTSAAVEKQQTTKEKDQTSSYPFNPVAINISS